MADDDTKRPKDRWDKFRIASQALSVLLIPVAIAFATVWVDTGIRTRQADMEMIRLALGVLQQDPEGSSSQSLRGWSIEIVNRYSGVPLPDDARDELMTHPLELKIWGAAINYLPKELSERIQEQLIPTEDDDSAPRLLTEPPILEPPSLNDF